MELSLAAIVFVCTFMVAWIVWPEDRMDLPALIRVGVVLGFASIVLLLLFGIIRL